jgi:hypothetical protein
MSDKGKYFVIGLLAGVFLSVVLQFTLTLLFPCGIGGWCV